jgi:hypothetical protein
MATLPSELQLKPDLTVSTWALVARACCTRRQVPVNHEFGFREGRQTLFAPRPPASAAHAGASRLVPRPTRLPLEATLAFNPGQKAICVGLYDTDICAEDLSMVWLTVSRGNQLGGGGGRGFVDCMCDNMATWSTQFFLPCAFGVNSSARSC